MQISGSPVLTNKNQVIPNINQVKKKKKKLQIFEYCEIFLSDKWLKMEIIINQVIIYKIFEKTDPYPSLSPNPEP